MSVIAAKVYSDKIIMAADSILVRGYSKRNTNFSKIAQINGMIVGGTGNAQEISLFWHYMKTHKPSSCSEQDILAFVVEFATWKNNMIGNSAIENRYLVIYQGHLFEVESLFVHEIFDYMAIGAGEDFANATLYLGHDPKDSVKTACELSCFVSEPITEYQMEIPSPISVILADGQAVSYPCEKLGEED